jgi:hypothetical protein
MFMNGQTKKSDLGSNYECAIRILAPLRWAGIFL